MTENQQHQSIYNINQQKQPEKREKPQLLKKPIPKPRRRITIGSGDSNKLNNEENIKLINKSFLNLNIKEEEKNIFKNNFNEKEQQNNNILINSLTTSKRIKTFGGNINNSPPYAPQLPRKILKSGSTPILQPKNQQKIFNQNLNEKHLKINNKLIEEFNKNKNKEKQINLQKQQFGELKRLKIPPPLKNQQQILNNKIIEKRSKTPIRRENEGKKVTSSSSPLFLHCPRASPEATGSSLNSPTSPPPLSTNFVNNWQNVEEGEQNEDLLLKELAAEGDPECLLIASWLESSTCANNGGGEQLDGINDGLDINENQRPRFSLDRLVPPELQLEIAKPIENNEQQICGEFSLQKSSPRGQCQGTVFIHFHQEKNNFDIKIEKEEEQKRIINLNKKKRPLSINNNNNFIKVDGTVEQRKQQNEVPYHHKQIEKEKEENKSKLINQNNNKISPYSTSPSLRSGVTLLEQLVKSHPIWFLPHLDRQAASHLLRHQEPGVFIVRGSSRIINNNSFTNSEVSASFHSSNQRSSVSVMALSVRLPPPKEEENEEIYEEKIDTDQLDHFLLEAVGSGQSVRLQGSPRTFTSLPLLLEHYCQPEAIQELKCSLCLPNSVAKCESIHSLQGLALLGQGKFFFHHQNSNHHFFYCESPCPSTTSTAVSAPPTSLIGGEPSSFYGYHHHQRANNNCCCCCCAANGCPGHQQQIMIQQQRQFAALPLRKSRSVQSSFISGTPPQPHYSSHKSTAASFCLSPSTQSLRESNYGQRFMVPPPLKKRGPESFLRALFSPSPQRRRQKGNESSWEWMPSSSPLWEEEQPTNTTNSGNKAIINNAQQQTLKPTTNTHLKQQQRQQPGSSIFARLKGNFRRTSSSGISSPSSKDDWQGRNQVSSELLNARQAAFRRTNTDLGVPTNSGTNRMALALNKMRKQQKPPNPSLPPQSFPQLARVLPQPRTTANLSGAKHSYIINGSSNFNNNNKNNNNNFFITPFAAPPSDIRKQQQNNLIKQTKVYLPTPPLRQRQNNLNNFIEKKNFDGGGFNNNNLNNSSSNKFSTKSQAVIATVHPQPKMVLNSCKKLQTNLDTKEIDDEEENNKLNNSSEYTHLNELFKGEPSTSGEENIVNFRDSFKNGGDEVSVAGTDFNEPWDSNAWENLLEIAKFGDAKTEVPLLSERPRRRRSSCDTSSISSNGSTWRRSSSDDNDEYLNKNKTTKENVKNEKIKQKEKCSDEEKENNTDDDINVAEEAVAMAVVLAGNGTLPNRKKPRPMEWLCEELLENENEEEEEENKINIISNESNQILPQNASLDTLILIEQAAKAANSSRCNMSQRVRWTRNSREASTSLMDIPSSSCAQIEQQNIPQKDG
uniref:SH2 domain-containing protein n=1 Tax=Meloidogyne hapla TaxID=6305 RepID=A0A1I8BUG9_MELHA